MSTILVLAECDSTGVRPVSLEHLALARTLGDPVAVVAGSCSAEALAQLAEHGAGMTYMATGSDVSNHLVAPAAHMPATSRRPPSSPRLRRRRGRWPRGLPPSSGRD